MSAKKQADRESHGSFEQALKRLEDIVDQLESGTVPLDEVLKIYEEGVNLSKRCLAELSQAELRIKKMQKDAKGHFEILDGAGDE
ncbi:MAG TPA: exodeoxyribonuclease VII small subunit [Bacteroidota bacterium]|nr:exodeoxyribonuclease VII small subunit [Bacteroidota bacterium]